MTAVLARSSPDPSPSYRRETELGPPVKAWLAVTCDVVVEEVRADAGVADLVGAVRRPGASIDVSCAVTDELQHLLVERCAAGATATELRDWAPWGWRGLNARAVGPLCARGILAWVDDTLVVQQPVSNPFAELVAVELKLKDWRRGLGQAGGYRLFANRSYLAVPVGLISTATVDAAARNRVGVLAVADDGRVTVAVDCPRRAPINGRSAELVAQRVIERIAAPSSRRAGEPLCAAR